MAVGSLAFNALPINMRLVLLLPSKDDYYGIGQSEALHFIHLTTKCDIMSEKFVKVKKRVHE